MRNSMSWGPLFNGFVIIYDPNILAMNWWPKQMPNIFNVWLISRASDNIVLNALISGGIELTE